MTGGAALTEKAITRHRAPIQLALWYLAITIGLVSAWILIAPQGFYEEFPAGPAEWVSALPPYNEHLERDFGAATLGLAALAGLAAVWMERRLVQAAGIALFAASLPHTAYHLTTTGSYSTADNILSLGALLIQMFLPLLVVYLASGARQSPAPRAHHAASTSSPINPKEV